MISWLEVVEMSGKRRATKERTPKELRLAFGVSILWLGMLVFFAAGLYLSGRADPTYVIVFGLAAALAWWWAIRSIRARNAAGKTLEELQALTPDQFEEWVGARFRDLGYSVKVSGASGDHGVDLLAEKKGEVAVIQCKQYKAWSVGEPILRDLFGAMHDFKADRAYLVTTGKLTKPAIEWVKGKPIEVWDGERVVEISKRMAARRDESTALAGTTTKDTPPAVMPTETKPASGAAPTCPKCGSTLVERRNRRTGEAFLGCPRYPACRYAQAIDG